ncbi:hypothetical protein HaLaN_27168, partial [Haematococcus lacustris]
MSLAGEMNWWPEAFPCRAAYAVVGLATREYIPGVLHLSRWLMACVEALPASPYDVRESCMSGRHRSGLGGRRSELVFCG